MSLHIPAVESRHWLWQHKPVEHWELEEQEVICIVGGVEVVVVVMVVVVGGWQLNDSDLYDK